MKHFMYHFTIIIIIINTDYSPQEVVVVLVACRSKLFHRWIPSAVDLGLGLDYVRSSGEEPGSVLMQFKVSYENKTILQTKGNIQYSNGLYCVRLTFSRILQCILIISRSCHCEKHGLILTSEV